MTAEDRLRQAIQARTSRVEPSADALHKIEEKLMETQRNDTRKRLWIGLGAAAAIIAVVVGALALAADDDDPVVADDSTTTTTDGATTSESTSSTESTNTTFTPTVDPSVPVWPRVSSSQRFEDPVSAARSFAVDFAGMVDPVVGEFQAGDSRSGEVPVRPRADGPVSTVLVRQLEDDTWFVLGSVNDDIRLDVPAAGAGIDCPVHLTGEALAFEGHVDVTVRADDVDEPIGTGFVQGGGGPSAPFDGEVDCDLSQLEPGTFGSIVLYTVGGEDSRVWQVAVVRVALT